MDFCGDFFKSEDKDLNNWLYKLEKKFGRYAVPNLTVFVIFTYVIGYLMSFMGLIPLVGLNPDLIMKGQIWRVFTWILMPPSSLSIFTIIMLFFYFQIGRSLEVTWGDFRYNVYLFTGFLFTLIGSFVIYFIGIRFLNYLPETFGYSLSTWVSTYYVNMSLFFAFAASYPDMQILLYFFIPLKIKYLAILDGVLILWQFIQSPWYGRGVILVSLLNFLIFYLSTKNLSRFTPHEMHRRNSFKRATDPNMRSRFHTVDGGKGSAIAKHKCAVCGRTELTNPELEFRFCSKCNGNYEYCNEHIGNHTHI